MGVSSVERITYDILMKALEIGFKSISSIVRIYHYDSLPQTED